MGILDVLRAVPTRPAATERGDTDTVKRIVAELDSLPAERARFLAAFAYQPVEEVRPRVRPVQAALR